MKVLVAGASGAIGRQLVPALSAAGHEVVGLARSTSATATLAVDALDRDALVAAVRGVAPDAVVNMLTAIPARLNPRQMPSSSRSPTGCAPKAPATCSPPPRRAAHAASSPKGWRSPTSPATARPTRRRRSGRGHPRRSRSSVAALRELEAMTTRAGGTVLRLGHLYGPATMFAAGRVLHRRRPRAKGTHRRCRGIGVLLRPRRRRRDRRGRRAEPRRVRRAQRRRRRTRPDPGLAARDGPGTGRAPTPAAAARPRPTRRRRMGSRLPRRTARSRQHTRPPRAGLATPAPVVARGLRPRILRPRGVIPPRYAGRRRDSREGRLHVCADDGRAEPLARRSRGDRHRLVDGLRCADVERRGAVHRSPPPLVLLRARSIRPRRADGRHATDARRVRRPRRRRSHRTRHRQ